MAFRRVPRKMARLDTLLKSEGGVERYVMTRISEGERAEDLSETFTQLLDEPFSVHTLYAWIRRWNRVREEVSVP